MSDIQRRPGLLFILLGLVAAFTLLLAACGGDDDDGGDDSGAEPTATDSAGGDDDDGGAEPTVTDGDGGDDDDGGDGLSALEDFASDYENFTGYVVYNATGFGDESMTSMGIYQKGDRSRLDISSSDGDVSLINTPDATYMCSDGQCLRYPADDESLSAGLGLFGTLLSPETIQETYGDLPDGVDIETSQEEIAGIEATCINYAGDVDTENAGDESGQICYAEGGLLLRVTFSGADGGTLEATEAGTEVDDSVFEPPFEVIDLSELGGMGQ